jgi:hypothetical protein
VQSTPSIAPGPSIQFAPVRARAMVRDRDDPLPLRAVIGAARQISDEHGSGGQGRGHSDPT